jgi:hypothetical protein
LLQHGQQLLGIGMLQPVDADVGIVAERASRSRAMATSRGHTAPAHLKAGALLLSDAATLTLPLPRAADKESRSPARRRCEDSDLAWLLCRSMLPISCRTRAMLSAKVDHDQAVGIAIAPYAALR